jgi:hypothetical protein
MNHYKPLSLIMVFFTIGANFISVCPANQNRATEVHLSIVPCTAHECSQAVPSHSCEKQKCEHHFCDDQSLIESNLPRQTGQLIIYMVPIPFVIADIRLPAIPTFINHSNFDHHASSPQLLTPLRI